MSGLRYPVAHTVLGSLGLAIVLVCTSLMSGLCSPTGLNIMPTANVLDADAYELQTPSSGGIRLGPEGETYALLQVGVGGGIEFGIDQRVKDGLAEAWLNAKWRIVEEDGNRPALALGVQNVARCSERQPYLVMSKSFASTRVHAGLIKSGDRSKAMLGIDQPLSQQVRVQADYISGGENSLAAGLGMRLSRSATFWVARSFRNSSTKETDYSVHLNLGARF